MIVFVRYNLGPGVAVELQEDASVAHLKEVVGSQQGVRPELLRVLFAGKELQSTSTLQGADLPEQSTLHVVLPPSGLSSSRLSQSREEEQDSLTRVDLSSSRLLSSSSGLAMVLEGSNRGGAERGEEVQAAASKGMHGCSTFFVYCKSCRSIKPGKLRVRCRGCKQTTLTLSRGPSCWNDVLLPALIHGICQSEGCQSNEAEFYMKCATHPTSDDDVSVALDLIMTNTRAVPCIACTDVMEVVLVFQCAERHVICLDCFRGYSQTRLNERQFVHQPDIGYSLPCAVGCDNSLIKEVHHFRVLGDDQYARYQQYGAEECLLAIGGLMCPAPGCGAGLLPPDGSRRVECDRQLGCGFVFCRDCRETYHQGACLAVQPAPTGEAAQVSRLITPHCVILLATRDPQNTTTEHEGPSSVAPPPVTSLQGFVVEQDASQRGRWDRASLLLIQESTKRCPHCSVPVERNGGCMHMHCPRCAVDWCWLCGVPWNRDCMGDHWFG